MKKRDDNSNLSCSFCGKSQREVKKLIAGPTVYICDECIELCNDIIAEEYGREEATSQESRVPKPREISRENRKVRVAVRATYEGEDWEKTQKEITSLMDAFDLPPGYSWSWNDRIVEQQDQDSQMGVNFLLALVLV